MPDLEKVDSSLIQKVSRVASELACGPIPSSRKGKKPPKELSHHRRAYLIYQSMPPGERSLKKVAEEIGKTSRVVEDWSTKFHWNVRAKQFDREVNDAVLAAKMTKVIEARKTLIDLLHGSIMSFKKKVEQEEGIDFEEVFKKSKVIREVIDSLYKVVEWDKGIGRLGNVQGYIEGGSAEEKPSEGQPVPLQAIFLIKND